MIETKEIIHIGVYGLIKDNNKYLLIDKVGGPYDGLLDLPGGTIEVNETIEEALIRELKEEVGIDVLEYKLNTVVNTLVQFEHKNKLELINHIGIIYDITKYEGNIKSTNEITEINDDSKGSKFYDITKIEPNKLSALAKKVLINEKL